MPKEKTYKYIPQIPHAERWSIGYTVTSDCVAYRNEIRHHLGRVSGPKSGEHIIMRGIPTSSSGKDVYLRFWASSGETDGSSSFRVAYDTENSETETMPCSSYENGGMVKVNANGIARFTINLPPPYTYRNPVNGQDMEIPSHFHYRLCYGNKMSPVQTQFLY